MKRKFVPTLLLAVLTVVASLMLGGFAKSSIAGEFTLLGPVKCERTAGKPDQYTFRFSSLDEQQGFIPATLFIWNGDVDMRGQVGSATIWVNGKKVVTPNHFNPHVDVLQVPLKNLSSENTMKVELRGRPGTYLKLQVSETGEMGPIFSGPRQYPFVCRTESSDLGKPIVDNYQGDGIPVDCYITEGLAGYSKDCSAVTRVDYFYRSTGGSFEPLERFAEHPADLDYTTTNDDITVPYIVRLERGTINRFIYGIAMLSPWDQDGNAMEAWNNKLFYQFSGGVAIGHDQGRLRSREPLSHEALSRGYAVAFSTGNRTGVHYNLELAGETAMMVKDHFVRRYGEPEFTLSIGGSGGAIQQYVFAQNHPGLLDGIIPQRSYSDMITQTIYVGDCMLMEFYFDVIAPAQGDLTFGGHAVNPETGEITHLGSPENRTLLEGMSASDTEPHPIYTQATGASGSTECVNGWLGLTPMVMNPLFTTVGGLEQFTDDVVLDVNWTHWDDLKNIYGTDARGYAPSTWDNVGVQYGLQALVEGNITLKQFLSINAMIGGWKKPYEMVPEGFPFSLSNQIQHLVGPEPDPGDFDPWSIRNATFKPFGIAPRTKGDIDAMHAAYLSGHVYIGELNIPAIDIRDYLDPVLDMHHAQQSFATRQRIIDFMENADNHLIWITDPEAGVDINGMAIDMMDEWLSNIQANPDQSVHENKPSEALDKCFLEDGTMYSANGVWAGILDDDEPGDCTEAFHMYSTSRIIAGGDIKGDIFKCHLMPVAEAIEQGFYGSIEIDYEDRLQLEAIFPDGVCDYSQGDAGRPGWY